MMKFSKTKYLQTHGLIQKIELNDINLMNYLIFNITSFEKWTYEGSGWPINSIIQYQIVISEIAPCAESSFFHHLKN